MDNNKIENAIRQGHISLKIAVVVGYVSLWPKCLFTSLVAGEGWYGPSEFKADYTESFWDSFTQTLFENRNLTVREAQEIARRIQEAM